MTSPLPTALNKLVAGNLAAQSAEQLSLAAVLAGQLSLGLLGLLGFIGAVGTVGYSVAAPALVPALALHRPTAGSSRHAARPSPPARHWPARW